MIVEDGTGIPGATTYVDPAGEFAADYVATRLYSEAWTSASAENQLAAVTQATRVLDTLYVWKGKPLNPDQGLAWPRSGVYINGVLQPAYPVQIQMATMEQAIAMLEGNRMGDSGGATQPMKGLMLGQGGIDLDFGDDPASAAVGMIPPMVEQYLKFYGVRAGTGGSVRRVQRSF